MKKYLLTLFIQALIVLVSPALAQEENTIDIESYSKDIEPTKSVGMVLDEQIDAYFRSLNVIAGQPSMSGKTYYFGTEVVSVSPENPNFPKALQIAFDKAFNMARAKFIFDRFGREVTNTLSTMYEDGSSDNLEFDPKICTKSKIESIYEKIVALAEGELDEALEENGIDPAEYKSTPPTAKKDLFLDKMIEKISRRASGDVVGMLPIKTFYVSDDSGTPKIGVVMVYSASLVDLAHDLRNGSLPSLQSKAGGKPLQYYIDRPEAELIANFGPRLVFNEQAQPVILGYAQWGSSYHGNDKRQIERSRDLAFEKADMQASQHITEFLNGKLSQQSENITGQVISRYLESDCKSQRETEVAKIVDEFSSKLQISASAKVSGSAVIKRWSYKDEYGNEILGVVRAWAPELSLSVQQESGIKHKGKVISSQNDVDPEESW